MKYLTDNQIACSNKDRAYEIADLLVQEGHVVMISKEDDLYIVSFEWTNPPADRNEIMFLTREEYEWYMDRQPREEL